MTKPTLITTAELAGARTERRILRGKPPLTDEKLVNWIRLFHEKTGYWPASHHKVVWEKTADDKWIKVKGESWSGINSAIRCGLRGLYHLKGSSLSEFRKLHGLHSDLTEEKLIRWITLFHEKTKGRWPTTSDPIVWDRTEDGKWFRVKRENWSKIHAALYKGQRGLKHLQGMTLSEFRKRHGLNDDLTEEKLIRWIKLFHEKEGGFYPIVTDKIVWDKNEAGEWIQVPNQNWRKIYIAIRDGKRGLGHLKGQSLDKFRKTHGLVNPSPYMQRPRQMPATQQKQRLNP